MFLSPKNNTEGALAVLDAAKCNIWVKPREQPGLPLVEDFLQQRRMRVLDIPEIDELLDAESTKSFPYTKTFDEAIRDPFCLLHTSGTTGLPKPVTWSHGLIGTMDAVRLLPSTEGDDGLAPWTSLWKEGDRMYSSFPMSHVRVIHPTILESCGLIARRPKHTGCRHHHEHTSAFPLRPALRLGPCGYST